METKLITIATFPDALKAQIVKGRLEAEGILSFIADEHSMTNQPYLTMIHGGVRLQVREGDSARAQEIIRVTQRPPAPIEFVPLTLTEKCPNCNSRKIEEMKASKRQSVLTYLRHLFVAPPSHPITRQFACSVCGHTWQVAPDEA